MTVCLGTHTFDVAAFFVNCHALKFIAPTTLGYVINSICEFADTKSPQAPALVCVSMNHCCTPDCLS